MTSDQPLYAEPSVVRALEDCHFYHVMDLPLDGTVRPASGSPAFDLRGREAEYLGGVDFAGRRVLEIGPANGALTFHMEAAGAEVVAVELGPDADWNMVPQAGVDLGAASDERRQILPQVRNGFWWAHARHESRAKVHYGDVYALPDELGRFDVAVLAAVLLHTREPLRIVEGCARLADSVVITEIAFPDLTDGPVARLHPTAEGGEWDTWWDFSPAFFVTFLEILGFDEIAVTSHDQQLVAGETVHTIPMFTVVARRARGAAPR